VRGDLRSSVGWDPNRSRRRHDEPLGRVRPLIDDINAEQISLRWQ
jgi:hypothetical protein